MTFDEYTKKLLREQGNKHLGYTGKSFEEYTRDTIGIKKQAEDIAPVKQTVKDDDNTWFKGSGLFDDGYQFGDVIGTILGTAGDVATGVVQGVGNLAEGVVDLGMYGVAAGADFFGAKDFAEATKENAKFRAVDSVADSLRDATGLEKASILGDKSDGISQGLGQVAGIILTGGIAGAAGAGAGAVSGITMGVTGASSFGSGIGEAYEGGATDAEAWTYGGIKGGVDAATEMIFGGLGKTVKALGVSKGLSSLDDMFARKLSSKISNQFASNMVELGVKSSAEGLEEVLAGLGTAVGKKLTYMSEEELSQLVEDENLLEQFISGAVVSGIAQSPDIVKATKGKRSLVTGLNTNEDTVINKEFENRVAEAEKDGKKLSASEKNKLYDKVIADMDKGYISIDTIEETLGGDSYKAYKDNLDAENALVEKAKAAKTEFDELNKLKTGDRTGEQTDRLEELRGQLSEYKTQINDMRNDPQRGVLKDTLSKNVFDIAKDSRLAASYNERANRGKVFSVDAKKLKGYDEKQRKVIQNAIDSGILNNTNRTHDFVDMVAKTSADSGVSFNFTNNENLKNSGFAVDGKVVNGFVTKDGVTVNIDSHKALNTVVGHEITHVLEGTDLYKNLQSAVFEYAKTKKDFDERRATLTELYKDVKDANVDAELTADLVGDYLFTDADFIKNLSAKHRNVFRKVYDQVKHLLKLATSGSREERELEKVKWAFEQAYRDAGKTNAKESGKSKADTKYSLAMVEEVQPTTDKWHRTLTTEEAKARFPKLWDVTADESEVRNPTQISSTVNSYRKVYNYLQNEGFDGKILDASSGLGYGTKAGIEEYGFDVDDIEPYPDKDYSPKYRDYSTLDKKYDVVISNAVLNVLPQDQRDALVVKMGEMLNDGGRIFINVRGKDVDTLASNKNNTNISPMEWFVDSTGSYQKGFTKPELVAYLKDALGDGFTVKPTNMFGAVSAIVTKDGGVKYSLTAEQQEYFKDSKVRDENGDLKVMYHGTSSGGFNVFDTYGSKYGLFGQGSYFTDNKSVAESYTNKGKGQNKQVYETYLNITNPMDMDAQADADAWRKAYPEADFPESGSNEDFYRAVEDYFEDEHYYKWEASEDLMNSIIGMGYDGITHIGGGRVNANSPRHQVYIAFNPEQIKNIDNAKPTDSADIRYSLSADSDGKKLTNEQSEFFKDSKMRDDDGNLKVMYHGSQDAGFHTFDAKFSDDDTSFFFVDRNDVAASYSGTTETYEARTIRTVEDMNNFLAEIGEEDYKAVEKNGKFTLLQENEKVADSDTAQGIYEEFCDWVGVGYGDANYKVYLNLKNPLVVDAGGRNWNRLTSEFSQEIYDKIQSLTIEEKTALTQLAAWEDSSIFRDELQTAVESVERGANYVDDYTRTLASASEKLGDADMYRLFDIATDNFSEESLKENAVKYLKTRDYAQRAKEQGHDGVIFKNIVDNGGYADGTEGASTVAIAFNSNQIKSVANEKPTGDPDIRYSLSEDNKGRALSQSVKNRFGNSKVVDDNGNLKAVYHGTATGEFSIFDKSKGSVEGDFGSGFYFTDNEADVSEHYEGGGPDFDNKVARRAEQIEYDEDIDYDEAKKRARDELYKGSHKFEVYLNIENPAIVGETMLLSQDSYLEEYNEDDYDDYDDYIADVEQLVSDDIDNIVWEVERNTGAYNTDGLSGVLFDAYYEGGIGIEELKAKINDLYLEDENGNLIGNEVVRQVIESLGYDGIIDPTVSGKWNMDIEPGTTHYIVFKPNQIKSVTNQNPTDNPDIHRSLSFENEKQKKYGNYAVYGEDVRLDAPTKKDIAPVQETISKKETVANVPIADIAPSEPTSYELRNQQAELEKQIQDAYNSGNAEAVDSLMTRYNELVKKADQLEADESATRRENLESLDDADAPPETEAPYYGESEDVAPVDPFENRDMKEVSKDRKAKAYMYENPEVKPFFQAEAEILLGEYNRVEKPQTIYNGWSKWEMSYDTAQDVPEIYRTPRIASDSIVYLRDTVGMSYADIEKGLKAIIEDNGAENIAAAKKIEFELNNRLLNGYRDDTGFEIPANQDYINLLNEKQITEYSEEARKSFFDVADDYIPREDDIAPVAATAPKVTKKAPAEAYEAIKPKPTKEPKLIRVKDSEDIAPTYETKKSGQIPGQRTMFPEGKTAEVYDAEPETGKKKSRGLSQFKTNFLDKGSVFEDLSLKTKNRELMGKWNHTLSSESRAQWMIGKGAEGVKSLNDIRSEVEKSGQTKAFYEYLYHLHNVDRMSLEQNARADAKVLRRELPNGSYSDIETLSRKRITEKTSERDAELIRKAKEYVNLMGVKNKPVFGDSVTAEVSQEAVKKFEAANPNFKAYAKDVYDYMNHLRKQMVDSGVISQETADLWSKMYPHYVPIRRLGDSGLAVNVPLDTGRTGVNAPIKKATGGNRDILPLFDTMALRTEQTFKAIARNNFGVELKNTLGTTVESNSTNIDEVIDSIDNHEGLLKKGENGNNPTFTVFEDGKKITFDITEDMYDALKPTSDGLRYTNKIANAAGNFHRGLLTEYNPVFMATNAIKDVQDVLINSQHPAKTYANMPNAFWQMAKHGKWYKEYMENGGERNTYFDGQTNTFTKEDKGIKKLIGIPLRAISAANNFIERAPRLAEYIASRKKGASVEVAMLDAARVTTNFAAGGDVTKFLNRNGATFLNASVQGALQQVRNVREAKAKGLKGWVQLATKVAIAGIPALILNNLLWEDDEEYEELSDYVKDNYYVVAKMGDGQFVRIPKGRTLAVIQSALEQTMNAATGNDEADLESFLELAISNLAPNNPIDNNILSPIMQVANNKTWYGEDLVPTRLKDLPKAEQFDESTDALSKWLGEKQDWLSPYQINYLLDQYSGGLGDVFLPMMTPEAESGDNSIVGNLIAPMKDKFTTDSVMNNQNVSDFYDTVDELTTNAKSSYATDEDVLKYKYMNSVNAELGELYARKREIQNSDLSDAEKYEAVRDIQKQIDELAEESLNTYGNVSINNGYATVGDQHYRWYEPGEDSEAEPGWQKITEKQLEKQEEVTSGLGISPSEYWSNKTEYDFAYEYPGKYAVAKSIGGYESYKTYSSELYDIKADKDENGKSISGSRKEKVIDYINNSDLDYYERLILFKSEYNADDTYNNEIIDYLNGREDISYEEMEAILKELGFTVSSDGSISW